MFIKKISDSTGVMCHDDGTCFTQEECDAYVEQEEADGWTVITPENKTAVHKDLEKALQKSYAFKHDSSIN